LRWDVLPVLESLARYGEFGQCGVFHGSFSLGIFGIVARATARQRDADHQWNDLWQHRDPAAQSDAKSTAGRVGGSDGSATVTVLNDQHS
jgi:hypothetical protein